MFAAARGVRGPSRLLKNGLPREPGMARSPINRGK
jgi:hypothetical protein